jgi:hypothetical protein
MSTGRIRGVPRQRKTPPSGLGGFGMPMSDFDAPVTAGPGSHSADSFRHGFNHGGLYGFQPGYGDPALVSPYGRTTKMQCTDSSADAWQPPAEQSPQLSPFISASFMEPTNALHFSSPPLSAAPSLATPLSAAEFPEMQSNFDLVAAQQQQQQQQAYAPGQISHDLVTHPRLLQYYAEQVRKTQFPLATDSMDSTLLAVRPRALLLPVFSRR